MIRRFALKNGIVDDPKAAERKIHKQPTALLGGLGIMGAMIVVLIGVWHFAPELIGETMGPVLAWVLLGTGIIALGGLLDDMFTLPARVQILFPFLAACVVVFGGGISIQQITNPFGGTLAINAGSLIAVAWLMVMTYTTKLLDGLDGLASGISAIGAILIALLALTTAYFQPDVALIAFVFFGALVGFLAWNFNPAQIFLGEAGSEFVGFFLGVLAIIAGSKIATALLVVGIPMLDVVQVMWHRFRAGKSIFSGDRRHLHFQLAERIGVRKTVWLLYAISAAFGLMTLSLQSKTKFIALIVVALTAIALFLFAKKKDPQA
jgi:UDP-GlcNAc:undecaprenyl-phosphate GlcNAc-1-phosphate transferase